MLRKQRELLVHLCSQRFLSIMSVEKDRATVRKLLVLTIIIVISAPCLAGDLEDVRYRIAKLDVRIEGLEAALHRAKGTPDAEQIIYDLYFLFLDRLQYQQEEAKLSIESREELLAKRRELDILRFKLDQWRDETLIAAEQAIKPTVVKDSLEIIEIERASGYVIYSIKVDVETQGPPGEVFVTIKGLNADGFKLDSMTLRGAIDGESTLTLTDTTKATEQEAINISQWEIDKVAFSPKQQAD